MTTARFQMPALLVVAMLAAAAPARGGDHVILESTGVEAAARGKASLAMDDASARRLDVRVQRLAPDSDYDLIVGGAAVHTLRTNAGGRAKARFDSRPRGTRTMPLAFDPCAKLLVVRAPDGDEVLAGILPPFETTTTSTSTTTMPPDTTTTLPLPQETTSTSMPHGATTTLLPETTTTLPVTCSESCWSWFFACLDGCRTTYCAPYCQVDLGRCLESCPQ